MWYQNNSSGVSLRVNYNIKGTEESDENLDRAIPQIRNSLIKKLASLNRYPRKKICNEDPGYIPFMTTKYEDLILIVLPEKLNLLILDESMAMGLANTIFEFYPIK